MLKLLQSVALAATVAGAQSAQLPRMPPHELPAAATQRLAEGLAASRAHTSSVWRDTAPTNPDGTVNAYVEIPMGELRKFEFDIKTNARFVDRVMPESLGGYPVNYGFVPQTMSWDGDPFDVLVLGPAIAGGTVAPGIIVGIMFMEDEKGLDSKVVVSPRGPGGQPRYPLTAAAQKSIGDYFARYRQHEAGKFSRVPGWGSVAEGRAHVDTTHAFFRQCQKVTGRCVVK
jgi:inorganic pyrophosphatase